MRNLDLDLLRTFLAVVESESFATAAQRVHRTQSAVSQQMQRLEAILDRTLLSKQGRTKQLTEEGAKLTTYARRLIALNDEALAAMRSSGQTQLVRIGVTHDMEVMLPGILRLIAKRHPEVLLEVRAGRSPFLMQELKRGELDLAVTTRHDAEHERVVLRISPTCWLCAADFVFDRRRPVPLVVSNEPSLFRAIAIDALNARSIPWRIAYVTLNLGPLRAAVSAGLGVTARNVEIVTSDLRVLGEADGLPPLPDVTYSLFIRDNDVAEASRRVFEGFRKDTTSI